MSPLGLRVGFHLGLVAQPLERLLGLGDLFVRHDLRGDVDGPALGFGLGLGLGHHLRPHGAAGRKLHGLCLCHAFLSACDGLRFGYGLLLEPKRTTDVLLFMLV